MNPDFPICGDPTCEGLGCRPSAIAAWHERMQNEAREILRSLIARQSHPEGHDGLRVQELKRGSRRWLPS